ncbi:flagellar export chaperone FliS [Syntrophotalea acetylenivorans]|uniref:Flagellar secretion chaperone FliS n=1 Tax=Syntrophotalea acetylenivorans TaxID=1842532 RepID=A0A1L3GN43_9BACT|nr:flagellar export chaperone FliS [Syntrophotalea acetylenivorans]APG27363.1 flagellar export chaperone FliS [Syntrophotalea acetylenivorans]
MNAYMNNYHHNQIDTASREQILIMLYDGAIRFTRQAINAIETGDQNGKTHGIQKAMAIISEFRNTLDHNIGGEIAANLDALYEFMISSLTQANLKNDLEPLQVVDNLLSDLRETWNEAIQIARKEQRAQVQVAKSDHMPLRASL